MKPLLVLLLVVWSVAGRAQETPFKNVQNPMVIQTANGEDYLTEEEKLVFAYLNLARTEPAYFADSVLKTYEGAPRMDNSYLKNSPYVTSLYNQLKTMKPLPPLRPSKSLYTSAKCYAEFTGKTGRTGHDRTGTDCTFEQAECCSYGLSRAVDIVMQLLIDKNVESLGHRKICLGPYTTMGLSIQPHKEYKYTAVLQFK